jgi:2-methylisocitrate lyase-like PEP mutase family enzyme
METTQQSAETGASGASAAGAAVEARAELARRLRALEFTSAPGVFELISARIADSFGFPALYMTGYGAVASHLGLPDAGLATYTEMVERVERICSVTSTPLIADGDTGYGGLLNVQRTVRGYERAGAAGIQLEDQQFPKKCGHTPGLRPVIPTDEAVAKIRVAVEARESPDFLVIARTDARSDHGLDEALRRGEAFAKAGADVLFIEGPQSIDEMRAIGRAFDQPLMVNMVDGGRTPVLPAEQLRELGYTIAIFPATGFLAMGAALRSVYAHIAEHGSSAGLEQPLHDFAAFSELMGFPEVWEFEARWAGQG